MANFFEKYRMLCAGVGSTPSAVAKSLGMSNSVTSHWKKGREPDAKTVKQLAKYFGKPVSYFMDDTVPVGLVTQLDARQPLVSDIHIPEHADIGSGRLFAVIESQQRSIELLSETTRDSVKSIDRSTEAIARSMADISNFVRGKPEHSNYKNIRDNDTARKKATKK